ncbi:hypothetical protein KRR40_37950 [Niabella defluvii]|nr:hypothetical protein KRR40_37950 [Niabella sp. I65]
MIAPSIMATEMPATKPPPFEVINDNINKSIAIKNNEKLIIFKPKIFCFLIRFLSFSSIATAASFLLFYIKDSCRNPYW